MITQVTELLGTKYPIIQGGMAWASNAKLAAAVSYAGGLGVIAGGNTPCEEIREEIHRVRQLTTKPFGVNIIMISTNAEQLVQLCIEEQVPVVITGAGNPGKYMEGLKQAGIKVIPVVPSAALAMRMEQAGADAVIAEGCEAGGHIGKTTTMCLIPQVADAVGIPVIAAGGIADGRGMAAAMLLGAQGVQAGTRFLTAKECTVHQNYKDMIISANDTDTVVTGRSTGRPVRSLKNKLTRRLGEMEQAGISPEAFEELSIGSLEKAVAEGDPEQGSFMAGQIAGLVRTENSCADILRSMAMEAKQLLLNFEMIRGVELE